MYERGRSTIAGVAPELWSVIQEEDRRQEELIASENYASPAVMAAQGTQLTTNMPRAIRANATTAVASSSIAPSSCQRPAQGSVRRQTRQRQPNSGSQANQAVLFGLLNPGDTIMGTSLAEGGHLTHGMPLNMSGKWFNAVSYGLDAGEAIDYEEMERILTSTGPG